MKGTVEIKLIDFERAIHKAFDGRFVEEQSWKVFISRKLPKINRIPVNSSKRFIGQVHRCVLDRGTAINRSRKRRVNQPHGLHAVLHALGEGREEILANIVLIPNVSVTHEVITTRQPDERI